MVQRYLEMVKKKGYITSSQKSLCIINPKASEVCPHNHWYAWRSPCITIGWHGNRQWHLMVWTYLQQLAIHHLRLVCILKSQCIVLVNSEIKTISLMGFVIHRGVSSGGGTVWAMWASVPPTFSTVWAWPTHFWHDLFFLLVTSGPSCRTIPYTQKKNVSDYPPPPPAHQLFSGLAHPLLKSFRHRWVWERLWEKVWYNLKSWKDVLFNAFKLSENGVLWRAKKSEIRLKFELSHPWI